jgi:hypothetical protein
MATLKGKEFAGQPWWVWAAAGTATMGALLYILWKSRKAGAAAAAAAPAPAGNAAPTGTTALSGFITDTQSSPAPAASPCPPGMHPNSAGTKCVCPSGYYWDRKVGKCARIGSKGKVTL